MVAACTRVRRQYWAAQSWPQPLPDLGYAPWPPAISTTGSRSRTGRATPRSSRCRCTGCTAAGSSSIFGRLTYGGSRVYGFGTTNVGAPTDGFGRLIYLDTHDSVYGAGWRRENSFVPHNPTGVFCYGFYTFDPTKGGYQHPPGQTAKRGPGLGDQYRLTAPGRA